MQFLKKNHARRIAIWGAGKRCMALLEVLGDARKYIDAIYDVNPAKLNSCIKGIQVLDYKKDKMDIIILSSGSFLFDVYRRTEGMDKNIVDIDEVIAGDLILEDLLGTMENKRAVNNEYIKSIKLYALTVLYNPKHSMLDNIKTYIDEVEFLYLVDNSPKENAWINDEIESRGWKNVRYQWNGGENLGLAEPINIYGQKAIENGCDWFITFDQDSQACAGMMKQMKEYAESGLCGNDVAVITPKRINKASDIVVESVPRISFVNDTIQSGAMHNLKVMEKIGGYDENIFIDHLDLEYCARCISKGYKIARVNHAKLLHEILNTWQKRKNIGGKEYLIGKYSPERYYYRHRNALYCMDKYRNISPLFVYMCEEFLKYELVLVDNDISTETNKQALKRAEDDYKRGLLGRLRGKI